MIGTTHATYSSSVLPLYSGGLAGLGHNSQAGLPAAGTMWAYVRPRFQQLLGNLQLTENQILDGQTKLRGIVGCLNRTYWGHSDGALNSLLIGSWAKDTRVRPPRDIDLHFILPVEVYYRFEQRLVNKQSQLLQEVRNVLLATYPGTDISGDRHVVVIPFDSYKIEVAPVFHWLAGGYLVCDTTGLGQYKHADPDAELAFLSAADALYGGNVRKLTMLLKQWQRECNVPIKSFQLEAVIKGGLSRFSYSSGDEFWFDWLVRDMLRHLIDCANGSFYMPGTGELIMMGDAWLSRAQSAYDCAVKACEHERSNENFNAGWEWQRIFGNMVPVFA